MWWFFRSTTVWEELPVAMDQLPQTGHPARPVHGWGGEADHQPPCHCWQQVGCMLVLLIWVLSVQLNQELQTVLFFFSPNKLLSYDSESIPVSNITREPMHWCISSRVHEFHALSYCVWQCWVLIDALPSSHLEFSPCFIFVSWDIDDLEILCATSHDKRFRNFFRINGDFKSPRKHPICYRRHCSRFSNL